MNEKHTKFIILSNFLSTITSLQNVFQPNYIAKKIQNKLEEARDKGKIITLVWVPSHIGIERNEVADKKAKLAITIIEKPTVNEVTYEDIKKRIEIIITEKCYFNWNSQSTELNEIKNTLVRWKKKSQNK